MPYYYFDSTALVKRYSMERGTRIVNKLMVKRGKVAILPTWTVTEFYSSFSNRAQQGEITRDDCYSVIHKFEKESAQGLFQFIAPTMQTTATKSGDGISFLAATVMHWAWVWSSSLAAHGRSADRSAGGEQNRRRTSIRRKTEQGRPPSGSSRGAGPCGSTSASSLTGTGTPQTAEPVLRALVA